MNKQARVVVADVATDPVFSGGSREMLLRSNVRSVQSTPLISPSGEFVGMVSTHYTRPHGPRPGMGQPVDELAAGFMAKT
jgi:GAF domain-containing protein